MEMNAFNLKWAGMQSEEEILARKEKRRARVVIPHYVENGLSFAYFEELPMHFYRIPLFLNRVLNYDEGECKIVCVNRYCMNLLYAPYWGKQR